MLASEIEAKIILRDNWPTPGITYVDTTNIFADGACFAKVIAALAAPYRRESVGAVVGIEASGFIVAAGLARALGVGLIIIRKKGKLLPPAISQEYSYEYSSNVIEIKDSAIRPGMKLVLADDVLATGATMAAAVKLTKRLGGDIIGISVIVEKEFLSPGSRLGGYPVHSLIKYQ